MLNSNPRLFGLVASLTSITAAWACANEVTYTHASSTSASGGAGGYLPATTTSGPTTTTTTGPGGGAGTSKDPPAPPAQGSKGDGPGVVLAFSKLFLGDTDRKGNPKSDAWQEFGYNIDGKISTATSTDHCKPHAGANPKSVKTDGKGGVDNSFGKTMVPIIVSLAADASAKVNEAIATGQRTTLVKIDTIGAKSDYLGLPAALYTGRDLGHAPKFDGTDKWPVAPEQLANPNDINSSKQNFPASYLANNVWVSGAPGSFDLQLTIAVAATPLPLHIQRSVITMTLAADRKTATDGIIAGVIPVEVFIAEMKKVAGSIQKDLCNGNTFDSLAENLRQMADINVDGGQDPSKECDAISIGLGFEAKFVQLGAIAPAAPPPPDPCK